MWRRGDEMMPWNDPGESGKLVRMAMNKALDRDQINEAIFKGAGGRQWVATLVPDFPAGYNPEWEGRWDELYGYDPERARALLAEAGYPNGFSFRIPVFPLSGVPEQPDMMEAMAKFWTEIGLEPELDPIEFSNWRNEYRGLNTDCCVYPFRGPAAPIDTRVHFYFSAERFFRAHTSDDIQENKNKALRALNEADATADWQKVSDEIFYEVATIPGWTLPVSATVDPDVVAEYRFLGPNNGNYVYLEYVKGVRGVRRRESRHRQDGSRRQAHPQRQGAAPGAMPPFPAWPDERGWMLCSVSLFCVCCRACWRCSSSA